MGVELSERGLSRRGQKINVMLRPLSKQKGSGLATKRLTSATAVTIAAYTGGAGEKPTSTIDTNYRAWRFTTFVPRFRGMYFERWESKGSSWVLHRAYFTLWKTISSVGEIEKEYLCLHCDPSISNSEAHAKYKQGPHLHIKIAEPEFPNAHIALAFGHLDTVLQSADNLFKAMHWSIEMIKQEVLDELNK